MSKEKNIEEAIERLKSIKEIYAEEEGKSVYMDIEVDDIEAIETVLADRERLEEENDRLKNINKIINKEKLDDKYEEALEKVMTKFLNNNIEKDFIPKQVIKDKIEELEQAYEDSKDEYGESPYFYPDYTINILQELLESEE